MIILNKSECLSRKGEIMSAIKAGKIFIYPTDTIYGIGCDATNKEAVQKIREIKSRFERPFSVIAPDKEWIRDNYLINEGEKLDILPGPYTVILDSKNPNGVSENVFLENPPGIRIPKN